MRLGIQQGRSSGFPDWRQPSQTGAPVQWHHCRQLSWCNNDQDHSGGSATDLHRLPFSCRYRQPFCVTIIYGRYRVKYYFPETLPKNDSCEPDKRPARTEKAGWNRGTNTDEHGLRALNQKDRTPAHTQMNTGLLLLLFGKLAGSQRFAVAANCL